MLAYSDGELALHRRVRVRRHLETCWRCRTQLAELEEQAQAVMRAAENQTFPSPARIAKAEFRFWSRAADEEQAAAFVPQFHLFSRSVGRRWVATGACIVLLAMALARRMSKPAEPSAVLSRIEPLERTVSGASLPVHQDLRVEIRPIRPPGLPRRSRLQLWRDSAHGRFASRWEGPGGAVRFAVWQTGPHRQWIYVPAVWSAGDSQLTEAKPERLLASLSGYGLEPEQLERALLRWLVGRRWTLVDFGSDFRTFCDGQGVVLAVERAGEGGSRLRLRARRLDGALRLEAWLEVDAAGYRPRLLALRLESAARAVEVSFVQERLETVSGGRDQAAIFEPDRGLVSLGPQIEPIAGARSAGSGAQGSEPGPAASQLNWPPAEELEVRVHYALHRIGACTGKPVEVERTSDGRVRVSGVADSAEQAAQWLDALGDLRRIPRLSVEIPALPEAASVPASRAADGTAGTVKAGRLPIEEQLVHYLAERGESSARLTELANRAVASSRSLLDEAWALRRAARLYESAAPDRLPPATARQLAEMVRDHVFALRASTAACLEVTGPFLRWMAEKRALPEADFAVPETGPIWRQAAALLRLGQRIDALSRALFGGAQTAAGPEGAGGDQAALELLAALDQLGARLDVLERQAWHSLAVVSSERTSEMEPK